MPFKIVSTSEPDGDRLSIVPSLWEYNGILCWPPKNKNILKLIKEERSKPNTDWKKMNCDVKSRNLFSYAQAEVELENMERHSETDVNELQCQETADPTPHNIQTQMVDQIDTIDFDAYADALSAPVPASVRPELPPAPAAPASTPARGASVAVCAVLRDGGGADLTALRLVEWLQLLHQFQVDKVYVYTRQPHPRVEAVLRRYACRGLVDISLLTLPPAVPLTRSPAAGAATEHDPDRGRKHELLPYNDCLYRALSRHAWLLNLQLDEMLVPLREGSLPRLAQAEAGGGGGGEQDEGAADALHFEHFSFPAFAWGARATPAPSLRMLALHRSAHLADTEGGYSVALYRTSSALATLRHTPLRCQRGRGERSGSCRVRRVAAFAARLHRYRAGCGELHARSCAALLEAAESDDTLQRWQHVAQEVDAVLDEIRFGPDL